MSWPDLEVLSVNVVSSVGSVAYRCRDGAAGIACATDVAEPGRSIEVIDPVVSPWDQETVYASVRVTPVYEDAISWNIERRSPPASLAIRIANACVAWLDAPVRQRGTETPVVGYGCQVEQAMLPHVDDFRRAYGAVAPY